MNDTERLDFIQRYAISISGGRGCQFQVHGPRGLLVQHFGGSVRDAIDIAINRMPPDNEDR